MQQTKPRIFYGWWIVTGGIVKQAYTSMTYSYGLSVFYKVLIDQFGWSRASLAGAVSLSRLEAGLLGGVEGFLVDRYGPRPVAFLGVILVAAGFILLSRIDSLFEFYLIFLIVAAGEGLSGGIPLDTTVVNWFIRRRGTAFGLLRTAISVAAAGVVLVSWFTYQYGWRAGFVAAGIGALVVGIPFALVLKRRPEYYGLLPDGDTRVTRANPGTVAIEGSGGSSSPLEVAAIDEDIGMRVTEALKTWAFWALSAGFAIRLAATSAVTLHAIPLVEDMGYSPATAAAVLGSIGMVSLIGRLGGGILNDIIGTKALAVGSACTLAFSFLIIAQAHSLWQVWLFVAIYAPSYGASAATMPAIKGDYFGRRNFGTIMGLAGILQTGGSMFGPVFAGYVYDVTKSYRLAFLVIAGVLLIAAALFMSLGRPRYSAKGH
ncbi:MAG: MFS transporter [Chloroflexi bacterium]|nr:MFS transporter [Chloroflexota bacterium]